MTLVVDTSAALRWFVGKNGSDRPVVLSVGKEPLIALVAASRSTTLALPPR